MGLINVFKNIIGFFGESKIRIVILIVILAVAGFFGRKVLVQSQQSNQFQTAQAQKGTLVLSVSASGTISAGNSVNITSQATGIVDHVYVKQGDKIQQSQKIADIILDQDSQQKLASAYSAYLSAQNKLSSDQNDLNTLQNTEFTANQKFINDAVERNLATDDPTYIEENAAWKAAEQNYLNQQNVIAQSKAAVNNAWLQYQQISPTITAPVSGTISNLTLAPGVQILPSSSTTSSSQAVGAISTGQGTLQANVNLSEIDVTQVEPGQKVTLTLDAFPGKTFTGVVSSINTNGVVSSGVTNYPATITLDNTDSHIYPNMAVDATIITKVKDNVLLVPQAAVQTVNGQSFVNVLTNGQIQQVPVQIGDASDTQTEIVSGLQEGDEVVVGNVRTSQTSSAPGSSPFAVRFGGGFGGGGAQGRRGQ